MMRKPMILLLLIVMVISLAGCWSRVELNDVAIVTATAVDLTKDHKIQLSLQVMKIKMTKGTIENGASSGNATLLFSEKGETIMDAYRVLRKKVSRELIFSHNRVIIIGDDLARSGLSAILDFFSRHREARGNTYMMTTKGEARDLLKAAPIFESFSAEDVREEEKARPIETASIRDYVYRLLEAGIEPVMSQIQIMPLSDQQVQESKVSGGFLGLVGLGVFHRDRLVGWLNGQEAECVLWLSNKMKSSIVTARFPDPKSSGKVSMQVAKSKANFQSKVDGDRIRFDVDIHMEGELFENTTKWSVKDVHNLKKFEQSFGKEVEKRVLQTVEKLKKQYKSDIVGFGSILHRQHKELWNDKWADQWDQEFPNIEVSVKADVKLSGTGRVNDSMFWKENELKK
ncbi:Ger(x)C family spore germination protein [Paenibacillus filicis]|uniref:Ger(X)C family spore germination protein n=1 Tax=Paenibacillus filicis TaxID=669464 RepID=A0ABU9DE47_9BACL